MIERRDDRLRVTAPMLMSNANSLLAAGCSAFTEKRETIDLAAVTEADSSALAVMLAWLRAAQAQGRELAFANTPTGVRSLAELYGLADLLPLV